MALSGNAIVAKAKVPVILSIPGSWDLWFSQLCLLVPKHLWTYFDSESDDVLLPPEKQAEFEKEPALAGPETFVVRNAKIASNQKAKDLWFKP